MPIPPRFTLSERLQRTSGQHAMLLWAALAGLAGSLATIAFRDALAGMQRLLVGHSGSFVEMAASLPWQMRVVLPCAGRPSACACARCRCRS